MSDYRVRIRTTRAIEPGEEVLVDYGSEYFLVNIAETTLYEAKQSSVAYARMERLITESGALLTEDETAKLADYTEVPGYRIFFFVERRKNDVAFFVTATLSPEVVTIVDMYYTECKNEGELRAYVFQEIDETARIAGAVAVAAPYELFSSAAEAQWLQYTALIDVDGNALGPTTHQLDPIRSEYVTDAGRIHTVLTSGIEGCPELKRFGGQVFFDANPVTRLEMYLGYENERLVYVLIGNKRQRLVQFVCVPDAATQYDNRRTMFLRDAYAAFGDGRTFSAFAVTSLEEAVLSSLGLKRGRVPKKVAPPVVSNAVFYKSSTV